jgi:hypothetical protein
MAKIRNRPAKKLSLPPRTRNRFRELEVARAVRAAKSAGGERVEIDPQSGKISVILSKSSELDATNSSWDDVLTDAAHQKRTP